MSKINFEIISSGSKGNAVIIENSILIDCGVSFKALTPYYKKFSLVLLTHIHSDHFCKKTIQRLSEMRPTLRFGCCEWLVPELIKCGVNKRNIDIYNTESSYTYCCFPVKIEPIPLVHNVENCGYKIFFKHGKMFYATDTNNLNGIQAKDFDLYLIEANYEDEEISQRISKKKEENQYSYEKEVLKNHLSKAKCDDFIYKNIGPLSEFVYMHRHHEE